MHISKSFINKVPRHTWLSLSLKRRSEELNELMAFLKQAFSQRVSGCLLDTLLLILDTLISIFLCIHVM